MSGSDVVGGLPNGSVPVLRFMYEAREPVAEQAILEGLGLDGFGPPELYVVLERFEKAGWVAFVDGRYELSDRGRWVADATTGG